GVALAQLIHRLTGITAICLTSLLLPLSSVQRILILAVFGFGILVASAIPDYDRLAARIVGPAVLVVTLAPISGLWIIVDLVALALIGFACFNQAGMGRAVPALGLPIMTIALRSGVPVPHTILVGWVILVVVTMILGAHVHWADSGPQLGRPPQEWRRPLVSIRKQAGPGVAFALILAPSAVVLAGTLDRAWPDFLAQPSLAGDPSGPAIDQYPGLAGGLDTGSPVSLSDEIVLRVRADRPLYWRGTTYDQWDGRHWTSSVETRVVNWFDPGVSLPAAVIDEAEQAVVVAAELPPPTRVTQRFQLERSGLDVLLGGWQISSLWTTGREAVLGADGSVRVESLGAGATWTVESSIVAATEDDLRRADPRLLPPTLAVMTDFAVEDTIVPQVAELARSITADAPTTYDKVRSIEDWMDANITYTREIDRLKPGADAVHHLLFESHQGFCEQIGSAMVVMLRSLGIPARLVVGYVPGSYEASSDQWVSRGTDAHAWAEVYFPGVGWQGFDPTAGVPLASTGSNSGLVPNWLLVASAAVGLLVVSAIWARHWLPRRRAEAQLASSPSGAVFALQDRFDHSGYRLGLEWSPSLTLRERAETLVTVGVDAELVDRVVRSLERLWFATGEQAALDDDDVELANADLVQLEWLVDLVLSKRGDPKTMFAPGRKFGRSRAVKGSGRALGAPGETGPRRWLGSKSRRHDQGSRSNPSHSPVPPESPPRQQPLRSQQE
ncbi:MAG: DUF3488 domain-containing transglutaminase family protein, partial [Actinomycetia bacterium]|nr:DUF3488 domain-containing transglutaminase family protein [Actinomycetes bacterium]